MNFLFSYLDHLEKHYVMPRKLHLAQVISFATVISSSVQYSHTSSMPDVASQTKDWTLCVICQRSSSSEALRDPSKSKYESHSSAYETLEESLKALDDLNSLPLSIIFLG